MTDAKKTRGTRGFMIGAILVLMAVPSGYLYLTGRQDRTALQQDKDRLLRQTQALADSLDEARTQLFLVAAQANVRAGDYEEARALTSDFFDRVDSRTRQLGAVVDDNQARLRLLARRDQAITALSRRAPEGALILEQLATLHLALIDPELKARTPVNSFGMGDEDTLHGETNGLPMEPPRPDTASGSQGRL